MSCYEWESGTITIPSASWAGFRTKIIKAYNTHITGQYNAALRALEKAKAATKGKRYKSLDAKLYAYEDALRDAMSTRKWNGYNYEEEFDFDTHYKATQACIKREYAGDGIHRKLTGVKWMKPQKKAYPLLPTTKSCRIDFEDASIALNNKNRTVRWVVSENNHACRDARQHPVARKLFAALGAMTFTRGTGGQIVGNDEYNSDSCEAGGGANYVTSEYGPKVKRTMQRNAFTSRGW